MNRKKFAKKMKKEFDFSANMIRKNIERIKKRNNEADLGCHVKMNKETMVNMVAIGELAELQEVLAKEYRGQAGHFDVLEEIADVYIVLKQLKLAHGISEYEVEKAMAIKTERCLSPKYKQVN